MVIFSPFELFIPGGREITEGARTLRTQHFLLYTALLKTNSLLKYCFGIPLCRGRATHAAFAMTWNQLLNPKEEAFVARFERLDVKYFCKVMTKTMLTEIVKGPFACQLEFPLKFLIGHACEFDDLVTFESKTLQPKSTKRWPIVLTVRHFAADEKTRVFAYGNGGWRAFFTENQVKIDDLLVFQLIGFSRFRVYMYPATKSLRVSIPRTMRRRFVRPRGGPSGRPRSRSLFEDWESQILHAL